MKHRKIPLISLTLLIVTLNSAYPASPEGELVRASGIKGGVVVHLGCGDGKLTATLRPDERFLVHGLDTDGAKVDLARAHVDARGIYGPVSAEQYDGKNLPYGDNMVNLILVEDAASVTPGEMERVLAPNGAILVKAGSKLLEGSPLKKAGDADGWIKYTKPWPAEIDQWTHYLYDATGNAVSRDKRVRRPRHLQWYAGPKRARHHDALASMSAMTTSNGRVFYIFDEGSTSLMHRPSHWKLVARDAFNGKLLWKRDIPDWMTHLFNFRGGPTQLSRRLVSTGDSVFVTLGLCAPAVKLDAASGKTLHTYAGSERTEELVYHDGMLLAVTGDPSIVIDKSDSCYGYWEMALFEKPTIEKTITAYDAKSGEKLWTVTGENLKHIVPLSLRAIRDNIFYLDNKLLHCLDSRTGKQRWASPFETSGIFLRAYTPTVVAHQDVIMCLKWNRLAAYSIKDGKQIWENKGAMGFGSPADLFAIGNKAWVLPMTKSIWRDSKKNKDGVITTGINIPRSDFLNDAKNGVGIDISTGKVTEELPFAHTQHHHRCHRNKATQDYILVGHSGIQVVDLKTKQNETHRWVRGLCQYGIMPANGYLYVPPDTCRCYNTGKINGFFALSEKNSWEEIKLEPFLEKGPAYSQDPAESGAKDAGAWPTYRADNKRSGSAQCEIPAKPVVQWSADLGKTITAPVIANNRVFVADRDAYTIHCLDAKAGKPVWKYLANGPIDSPPTIYKGLCIFGCGDGSVYCLDAKTGKLAWRFKTSRIERRVGHEDRLESPLRIHGSALVEDDTVYFAAGYSSNLDGGVRLYGVDVRTGEQKCQGGLASGPWDKGGGYGFLADVLASNGETLTMRQVGFTKELQNTKARGLIEASTGLLEDAWFHRQDWSGAGNKGQLIVFREGQSFSVSSPYTGLKNRRKGKYQEFNQVGHFHQKFARYKEEFFPVGTTISARGKAASAPAQDPKKKKRARSQRPTGKALWSKDVKLQPRAMVLAGDKLCMSGWMDAMVIEVKTGRPKNPANPDPHDSVLRIYSAETGEQVSELKIESEPVFDGMAAAYNKLFLTLKNGKLLCLGE
jgi:outer membrane protein assembly factor BamB